jgi:nitrite reductase/ring-hydroxylating ferredoxin subunit
MNDASQAMAVDSLEWHDVGEPDDFPDGAVWPVIAAGTPVAVFRQGEALHALHDLCTHGNARLSDGYVENGCIECPLHQGLFDIRTGETRGGPVTQAVRSFPVQVRAGRVEVGIEARTSAE